MTKYEVNLINKTTGHVVARRGEVEPILKPVLEFIDDVIKRGESVLVHCLAGAHRAGTTGDRAAIISTVDCIE